MISLRYTAIWFIALIPLAGQEKGTPSDDIELVQRIRKAAIANAGQQELVDYINQYEVKEGRETKQISYEMVAIKGGSFVMGSPDSEDGRKPDEGPIREIKISPFWMGKYEITWQEYNPFTLSATPRGRDGQPTKVKADSPDHFVVSKPTAPYVRMDWGMGMEDRYPAISMTQHAASKFCQWLSAKTGHFYRLPTEAEWEYACRAGTTGPFSCPPEDIHEYAVCEIDLNNPVRIGYQKVGSKKPNPWGLHDMHGNVMEWCLDQYNSLTYKSGTGNFFRNRDPYVKAYQLYPRVCRGGSWYDLPEDCRSATRYPSDPSWKQRDPQLPKSYWYHTDALWLGFRIVRPFELPSAEEMDFMWNSSSPDQLGK